MDTGSEANILPEHIFRRLPNVKLCRPRCRLVTYSGERIHPIGEATIDVCGKLLRFQVINNGCAILGIEACIDLGLIYRVHMIETAIQNEANGTDDTYAKQLVNKYKHVFKGLGCIKSNAVIHIDSNISPVIDPPRRIPHAIQEAVRNELDKMMEMGVIVKQDSPTPWVNSITIVKKPNKLRICLDPTKLNCSIEVRRR